MNTEYIEAMQVNDGDLSQVADNLSTSRYGTHEMCGCAERLSSNTLGRATLSKSICQFVDCERKRLRHARRRR
jgi:hypothetical protein